VSVSAAPGKDCSHLAGLRWFQRWMVAELGARRCSTCGALVRTRQRDLNLSNLMVLIAFGVSVTFSVQFRSYVPYLLLPCVYFLGRFWLITKAPLVATSEARSRSFVWLTILVVFIWVLIQFG
jgi:hypothetical protein